MKIKFYLLFIAISVLLSACPRPPGPPRPEPPPQPEVSQMPLPGVQYGGRFLSLASPMGSSLTVLAASESGGIFKSTDGGSTWQRTNFPAFDSRHIAFLPGSTTRAIATAQSAWYGSTRGLVYMTDNAGDSWTEVAINVEGGAAIPMRMQSTNITFNQFGPEILIATNYGMIKGSTLVGYAPFVLLNNGMQGDEIIDVEFVAGSKVVALINSPDDSKRGLWVSDIRGENYRRVQTLNAEPIRTSLNHITTDPNNKATIFVLGPDNNFIFYTTDTFATSKYIFLYGRCPNPEIQRGGRDKFIKTAANDANSFYLYFGSGMWLYRSTIDRQSIDGLQGVQNCIFAIAPDTLRHPDPSDILIKPEFRLISTDGGLQKLVAATNRWKQLGPADGVNALQIYDVNGYKTLDDNAVSYFFGTQDNHFWYKNSTNPAWEHIDYSEGGNIKTLREKASRGTELTSYDDNSTTPNTYRLHLLGTEPGNLFAVAARANFDIYNSGDATLAYRGQPVPIKHSRQFLSFWDSATQQVHFGRSTAFTGLDYTRQGSLPSVVSVSSTIKYSENLNALFIPTRPHYDNRYNLHRVEIMEDNSLTITPVDSTGVIDWTKYKSYDVNPFDKYHIIGMARDKREIIYSINGGNTWVTDFYMSHFMDSIYAADYQNSAAYLSATGGYQAFTIAFNPVIRDEVFFGTPKNGIYMSENRGAGWRKIEGSEKIPYVTGFFFDFDGSVIVSSFGRGLFRITPRRLDRQGISQPPR